MLRTLSSWKMRSIRLAHFTGPRMGAMRSLALASVSDENMVRLTNRLVDSPQLSLLFGSFATTLPFSHTYIGVPYMRATLRAVRALFLKPRPTPAAKLSVFFG